MRRGKYMMVAERLAARIRNGDYQLNGIPAERDLAEDVGVSHMTARKAIRKLLDDRLIVRLPNGRLGLQCVEDDKGEVAQPQVALLAPSWESAETNGWNITLSSMASRQNFSFRLVYYLHADDPVIKNTLRRFDCTFFLPTDPMPSGVLKELLEIGKPFVILNNDWSHLGIPSIRLFPPVFVQKMLDHLDSLGHRRIDCFNVQPGGGVIEDRITQWRIWMAAHHYEGQLYDYRTEPYSDTVCAAYETLDLLIKNKKLKCDALLCLTEPAAIGAMRALADNGIRPGVDIGVCTTDSGGYSPYTIPSITAMEQVNPQPYISAFVRWIHGRGAKWEGQLLIQPADIKVVARQSTIPGKEFQSLLEGLVL